MSNIKVAARSRTSLVAGAIAGVCRDNGWAEVQAIGAGAVNQAVKAVIIAKGYLAEEQKSIVFIPAFVEVEIDGEIRTAVRLSIEVHMENTSVDAIEPAKLATP
jgi:stage V sporulation protein S